MTNESVSVAVRLPEASRAQLDALMARWGVPMSEAIRRAIWLCWRAETCGDPPAPVGAPQPSVPPAEASQ